MNITLKRHGISEKFYQVHRQRIDGWVNAFIAGNMPPHFRMVPIEPLSGVASWDAPSTMGELVTVITLLITVQTRYDRSGPIERVLIVTPDDRSRPVIDEWERKHKDKSAEDILWFPSSFERCA